MEDILPDLSGQASARRHTIISWTLLALGAAISIALTAIMQRQVELEARHRFEANASDVLHRVRTELGAYEEVLVGLGAFMGSKEDISRAEFRRYVEGLGLGRRFPGFENLSYARVIPGSQLKSFENGMRREGHPDFVVTPAGARDEYYVITYIEPGEKYAQLLGKDMLVVPGVARALERQRDTGEVASSGRPIRVEGPNRHVGLAMRLAVYSPGAALDSLEARRKEFRGTVGAGYRLSAVMRAAVSKADLEHLRFRLYDQGEDGKAAASEKERLLFDSNELVDEPKEDLAAADPFEHAVAFSVAGRAWQIQFTAPKHASGVGRSLPWLVLAASLIATLFLFGLFKSFAASRRRAEALATDLATRDALTGLPNRLMFGERLSSAIARAERAQRGLAVLMVDLDRFKNINDTLGHGAGDAVLKACAERLRRALRDTDLVAHISGDEFAVLVDPCPQPAAAIAVARKVLNAIERPLIVQGQELVLTGSAGIAIYHEDGRDTETLLKHADIAMFRAKESGRNNYQFYTAKMNPHSLERLNLEAALRRALERQEFELHYQPKLDLRSGAVTGVEALLRWRHAELGMVSPAQFIPIAEETGLIEPIGAWVLREACAQAKQWDECGLHGLRVAVNLSARQFRNQRLARDIQRCLAETGTEPSLLELELTESMVMQDPQQAAAMLKELKAMGLTLSIDDFGTGYSSLAYLKRFPIDSVKVDRSFVKDIPADAEDAAIVESVIVLAHSLRLRVVAEGVETAEQQAHLRNAGCDEMQGYLFSKPLPAEEAMRFLEANLRKEGRTRVPRPALSVVS